MDHAKFQIELRSPYEDWRQAESLSDGSVDADGDGFSDLLEYALGSSPLDASEGANLSVKEGKGFQTGISSFRSDIDYQFEGSSNLKEWRASWFRLKTAVFGRSWETLCKELALSGSRSL